MIWTLAYYVLRPEIITCCFSAKPVSPWSLLCADPDMRWLAVVKRPFPNEKGGTLGFQIRLPLLLPMVRCLPVSFDDFCFLSGNLVSSTIKNKEAQASYLGSTLVLEFDHYSLHPWNQNKYIFFSQALTLDASQVSGRMGKKSNSLFVCGPGLPFPYDEFVLVFKVVFCLLNGAIVFFFSLLKKKSYLVYLPSVLLPPHPTLPYEQGSPLATQSCKAFLLLVFSLYRYEIAAPVVFFKINFVMVLKKKSKCIVALSVFNKGKSWKENRQHQQIICGQVLNYIYMHIYIYILYKIIIQFSLSSY